VCVYPPLSPFGLSFFFFLSSIREISVFPQSSFSSGPSLDNDFNLRLRESFFLPLIMPATQLIHSFENLSHS